MLRSLLLATLTLGLSAQTPAEPKPAQTPAPAATTALAAKAAPAAKPVPTAAPAQAAAPKKEDKTLAYLGKTPIKESDFDLFLSVSLPEQQRMQVMMMPGAKDQYLKRFLDYKVLAAKANLEGIAKTPDFAKKMELMRMQVLIQTLFERDGNMLKDKSNLKDEDVKAFFDKHPEKFVTPESFSARHILVSTRAQGQEKARTDEEALARVKVVQEALKGGKSFDDAAKEFSDDPGSKDKGGLYENMPFGRFVPEFDKAVRDQEPGKVGEPVKSMHGYHLILVEKITKAVPQTFDAAKEAAKQQAAQERQESVMNAYMDAAKKQAGFQEGAAAPAAKTTTPKASKAVAKKEAK